MADKLRALVADDDPTVGLLMPAALAADFELTLVEDGKAALMAYVGPTRFDLLVLDVEMPEMDGLAVAAQVRAVDPAIPIILLTGRDDEAFRAASAKLSAKHLHKPVNWRTLASDLRALL